MAGCTTLAAGGALTSIALSDRGDDDPAPSSDADTNEPDVSNGVNDPDGTTNSDDDAPDTDESADGTDGEAPDEETSTDADDAEDAGGADEESADGDRLELSVSATESVSVRGEHVDFQISVTNRGENATTVPVTLEIGHVAEEIETLGLDADEVGNAYESIEARSFGSGTHEWTVAAGDEVATGTVTIEPDDGYDENQDALELTMGVVDGATVRLREGESSTRVGCEMTVFNHSDEPASTVGRFEIANQIEPIEVDLEGRESERFLKVVELDEGDYEWTATVADQTETGTLHVVSE